MTLGLIIDSHFIESNIIDVISSTSHNNDKHFVHDLAPCSNQAPIHYTHLGKGPFDQAQG